jgi:hypothetical protein
MAVCGGGMGRCGGSILLEDRLSWMFMLVNGGCDDKGDMGCAY